MTKDKQNKVDLLKKYAAHLFGVPEITLLDKSTNKHQQVARAVIIYLLVNMLDLDVDDFAELGVSVQDQTRGFESGRLEIKLAEKIMSVNNYALKIK